MRNPNGYGSVYKLSGTRRKPYAARVTVGFKPENGYPIYRFIGYYKTRAEALKALALYNDAPDKCTTIDNVLVPTSKITLERVYNEWSDEHFKEIKPQSTNSYKAAIRAIKPLFSHSFESLIIRDYEDAFEESGKSRGVLSYTKTALKNMYKYAYRRGYINDASLLNIAENISLGDATIAKHETAHKAFTHDEIKTLWAHKDEPDVQTILFLIYSGLRIGELSNLKQTDVNLDERFFEVTASKTEAGVRKVPINEKIVYILENWLLSGREYLAPLGKTQSVRVLAKRNGYEKTIARLFEERHLQHDTRYTCATLLTESGVDDRYIKLILGHAQQDVTNKVYAKKLDVQVLVGAINQI